MSKEDTTRTITARPPITFDRIRGGKPVLNAEPTRSWESRVVLNPAAVLVEAGPVLESLFDAWNLSEGRRIRLREEGGACVMIYRAQGDPQPGSSLSPSRLGLAVFSPSLDLVMRHQTPVIEPDEAFHDLGVEDPRCTRVGDTFYLYYTGYASVANAGSGSAGTTRICLATTTDFLTWDLRGPVDGDVNLYPNKNPALLPEQVGGKWLLLHRPMEGPDAMTIHLAEADRPEGPWRTRGRFMQSHPYAEFARSWIGPGGPPIALGEDRFVMVYHQGHLTHDQIREYDLAVALIDFKQADPIVSRIEPIMRPSRTLERRGDPKLGVDNVLFTCANYLWGSRLIVPYAGADSRIFGATLPLDRLLAVLEQNDADIDTDEPTSPDHEPGEAIAK